MKEQYSVGEFSEMFRLNVQTLRYYDSIGLFRPDYRNQRTGRRSYAFEQVYGFATIRFLRRLGYSLEEVQDYLNQREAASTLDILEKRSVELRRQMEKLTSLDNAIRRKICYTTTALGEVETHGGPDSVTIQHFKARHYIPIGDEEILYHDDSFYLYPTVVFYQGKQKTFGAYLHDETHDGANMTRKYAVAPDEDAPQGSAVPNQRTAIIPAGSYLCGYHRGPYDRVHETDARLRAAHPDVELSDITIDFNIIDQFVERDSEHYLTGMQIMVK